MKICVVGAGYVGLVSAACFSEFGFLVKVADINKEKIESLNNAIVPIYEPGLDSILKESLKNKKISFTCSVKEAALDSDAVIIAVGSIDSKLDSDAEAVIDVIYDICLALSKDRYTAIIIKSTANIGMGETLKQKISFLRPDFVCGKNYDIVSNPGFLREGSAVHDFMMPDRIVVGIDNGAQKAKDLLSKMYEPISSQNIPIVFTNIETAELIKYAASSFLAVKLAFINEMSDICERSGADVSMLSYGMGLDPRIGGKFLEVSPGFGGPSFYKDANVLSDSGDKLGVDLKILNASLKSNAFRKKAIVKRIIAAFDDRGGVDGKNIAVLGLTFKPETDDTRESPSIEIVNDLARSGAIVRVYDPMYKDFKKPLPASLEIVNVSRKDYIYDAIENAEAIVLLTNWNEFRFLDLKKVKNLMKYDQGCKPLFFDMRNLFGPEDMGDFCYHSLGRPLR